MTVLASNISALEFWRDVGPQFPLANRKRQSATRAARNIFAQEEKLQLEGVSRRPAGCELPLNVPVPHE